MHLNLTIIIKVINICIKYIIEFLNYDKYVFSKKALEAACSLENAEMSYDGNKKRRGILILIL